MATALPMGADEDRGPSIPASVLAARKAKKLEKRAARAAQDADRLELAALEARDGGHGSTTDAAQQAEHAAQQARAIARDAEQARAASARPPRTTERERMWAGGGPGVYSGETSREYIGQLRCDEFATDIQPEIMDGKNRSGNQSSSALQFVVSRGLREVLLAPVGRLSEERRVRVWAENAAAVPRIT